MAKRKENDERLIYCSGFPFVDEYTKDETRESSPCPDKASMKTTANRFACCRCTLGLHPKKHKPLKEEEEKELDI